jgi:hypothetical protein
MHALRQLNLTIAFILELAILLAVGYAALTLPLPLALQVIAALAAAILMAGLWGLLVSPRASMPLHGAANAAFQIAWFGTGAVALATTGRVTLAATLAAVYILNSVGARSLWNVPHGPGGRDHRRSHRYASRRVGLPARNA